MKIDTSKHLSWEQLQQPIEKYLTLFKLAFFEKLSVQDVRDKLVKEREQVEYFYTIDSEGKLTGVLTMRALLYSSPETELVEITDPEVLKVYNNDSLEKGLRVMTQHKLLALPVVDQESRFVGILKILAHDGTPLYTSRKQHRRNAREDLFQFIGFSIEQKKMAKTWTEYRLRMPWLLCNLVGGLICAVIGEAFEATLITYVMLALLIPLVLSLSESIGVQSMTISLRFLHQKKIYWSQIFKRLFIESQTSFLLGITSSILIACFYFAWSTEILPIVAIGLSVIISMIISALFGALFPIILHALSLDPKVAAGPVVLTMADIITVTIYFGTTTLMLM